MNTKTMLAPRGSAARPGYAMAPKYITIHNTANTGKGAGAESHGQYLQGAGSGKQVSYHYAVDSGLAVQIIPDNEVAWHAGDGGTGTGNRQSLAIEICENPESDLRVATGNAAALTAGLMKKYGIPLANVVQHHRWSGKDCPRRLRAGEPYGWNTFLEKVQAAGNAGPAAPGNQPSASAPAMRVVEDTEYEVKNSGVACEYFHTANVEDVAGVLAPGRYPVARVMAKADAGWNWVTLRLDGREVWVVLREDRSALCAANASGPWYYVQAGAFRDLEMAKAWVNDLQGKGVSAIVKQG